VLARRKWRRLTSSSGFVLGVLPSFTMKAFVFAAFVLGALFGREAGATPPPTADDVKRQEERARDFDCVHCAGRGDSSSNDYQNCSYLVPYGFSQGDKYWDIGRYGTFWCRRRTTTMALVPPDIVARAEGTPTSSSTAPLPAQPAPDPTKSVAHEPPRAGCAGCSSRGGETRTPELLFGVLCLVGFARRRRLSARRDRERTATALLQ
jgi:hypothetical protein